MVRFKGIWRVSSRLNGIRLLFLGSLVAASLLCGCSSEGTDDWSGLLETARSSWENRDGAVKLDEAAAIPFATLGVRIDGGRQQIAVLATEQAGERLWAAPSHAIVMRNGRIVRTSGFGTDLSGYSAASPNREDWSKPHRYSWVGDFNDQNSFAVPVVCELRPAGVDPIEILGQKMNTFRVQELCRSEALDWSFENNYWVSADTGRVWRSVQHIHPKGPSLEVELLRPPVGPD